MATYIGVVDQNDDGTLTDWKPDFDIDAGVTLRRVQDITYTPMSPLVRNRLITGSYQRLANDVSDWLYPGVPERENRHPTWLDYAMWSSETVGESLRRRVVTSKDIRRALAHGNRGVFGDVGWLFVHLIQQENCSENLKEMRLEEERERPIPTNWDEPDVPGGYHAAYVPPVTPGYALSPAGAGSTIANPIISTRDSPFGRALDIQWEPTEYYGPPRPVRLRIRTVLILLLLSVFVLVWVARVELSLAPVALAAMLIGERIIRAVRGRRASVAFAEADGGHVPVAGASPGGGGGQTDGGAAGCSCRDDEVGPHRPTVPWRYGDDEGGPPGGRYIYIYNAYEAYCRARSATDETARAQYIHLGNLWLVYLEQHWLGDSLAGAFRMTLRRLARGRRRLAPADLRAICDCNIGRRRKKAETKLAKEATRRQIKLYYSAEKRAAKEPIRPTDAFSEHELLPGLDSDADVVGWVAVAEELGGPEGPTDCWLDFDGRIGFIKSLFRHHRPSTNGPLSDTAITEAKHDAMADFNQRQGPIAAGRSTDPWATGGEHEAPEPLVGSTWRKAHDDPDLDGDRTTDRLKNLNGEVGPALDTTMLEAAVKLAEARSRTMTIAFFTRVLPEEYAGAFGVQGLAAVSELSTVPVRRAADTYRFVMALLAPGYLNLPPIDGHAKREPFWEHGTDGFKRIERARRAHTFVRDSVDEQYAWDIERLGAPANLEDTVATMCSLVVPVVEFYDHIHRPLTPPERDALAYAWQVITYLMGGSPSLLVVDDGGGPRFRNYTELEALTHGLRARLLARTMAGTHLMEELIADVEDHTPGNVSARTLRLMWTFGDEKILRGHLVEPISSLPGRKRIERWGLRALDAGLWNPFRAAFDSTLGAVLDAEDYGGNRRKRHRIKVHVC